MNEPITTTQAHKLFGELYQKPRPPELQQKVDEIIEKYKDVYVRIKKIQELDEAFTKQIKKKEKKIIISLIIFKKQKTKRRIKLVSSKKYWVEMNSAGGDQKQGL